MTLADLVLGIDKIAIVGTAKNTGKTECLNYLLKSIPISNVVAVTSIGMDGEKTDLVTNTSKPEIFLKEGTVFTTSEAHYRNKKLVSEIIDLSVQSSSLGRLIFIII